MTTDDKIRLEDKISLLDHTKIFYHNDYEKMIK